VSNAREVQTSTRMGWTEATLPFGPVCPRAPKPRQDCRHFHNEHAVLVKQASCRLPPAFFSWASGSPPLEAGDNPSVDLHNQASSFPHRTLCKSIPLTLKLRIYRTKAWFSLCRLLWMAAESVHSGPPACLPTVDGQRLQSQMGMLITTIYRRQQKEWLVKQA